MKKNTSFKTTGIILRKVDFKESDRIITVLTQKYGKIDLLAKSIKKSNSKFCGRLELFYEIEITGTWGQNLHYLKEVKIINAIQDSKILKRHQILFYLAEITNKLLGIEEENTEVYRLFQNLQITIDRVTHPEICLFIYLIKLLTSTGFLGIWNECANCDSSIKLDQKTYLCSSRKHIICNNCRSYSDQEWPHRLVKLIYYIQKNPFKESLKINLNKEDSATMWNWLQSLLIDILEKNPKSLLFLNSK